MAKIDTSQDFTAAWNLGEETLTTNDTPYADGSLEARYWPKYKELFMGVMVHAEQGDVEGLKWHCRTFEILLEKIQDLIAGIDADE